MFITTSSHRCTRRHPARAVRRPGTVMRDFSAAGQTDEILDARGIFIGTIRKSSHPVHNSATAHDRLLVVEEARCSF
jgi:hypothetical protein